MQSFKYSELDDRGKSAVLNRYGISQTIEVCEWCEAHPVTVHTIEAHRERLALHYCEGVTQQTSAMGWRFTEHGERVA